MNGSVIHVPSNIEPYSNSEHPPTKTDSDDFKKTPESKLVFFNNTLFSNKHNQAPATELITNLHSFGWTNNEDLNILQKEENWSLNLNILEQVVFSHDYENCNVKDHFFHLKKLLPLSNASSNHPVCLKLVDSNIQTSNFGVKNWNINDSVNFGNLYADPKDNVFTIEKLLFDRRLDYMTFQIFDVENRMDFNFTFSTKCKITYFMKSV